MNELILRDLDIICDMSTRELIQYIKELEQLRDLYEIIIDNRIFDDERDTRHKLSLIKHALQNCYCIQEMDDEREKRLHFRAARKHTNDLNEYIVSFEPNDEIFMLEIHHDESFTIDFQTFCNQFELCAYSADYVNERGEIVDDSIDIDNLE